MSDSVFNDRFLSSLEISRSGFAMARSSQALSAYQLGDFDTGFLNNFNYIKE